MGKRATYAACGAVALSTVGLGVALDLLLSTAPLLSLAGAVLAAAYLVGTFGASIPLFGRVARGRPERGRFSLTFDDGPDPRFTPTISRLLAERGHRATFFVLARQVRAHPGVAAQLVADGHELASHGDDHRLLAFASPGVLRAQLLAAEEAVREATGRAPAPLFRAPHGVRSPWLAGVVARCGYRVCAWSGGLFDTVQPGAATIAERARRHLEPGAVVLLHDGDGSGRGASREQTVEALPAILTEAERRGLRSVPLSALVRPAR